MSWLNASDGNTANSASRRGSGPGRASGTSNRIESSLGAAPYRHLRARLLALCGVTRPAAADRAPRDSALAQWKGLAREPRDGLRDLSREDSARLGDSRCGTCGRRLWPHLEP